MSFNQSRGGEKSESQYRKTGRSGNSTNPRSSSGPAGGAGGKGGGGNAPPPQASAGSSTLTANRSFKKPSNGQGAGQSTRVGVPNANSQINTRVGQNGAHFPSPASGFSEAPAPAGAIKQPNPPAPRSTRPVPKAPSSQTASGGSDSVAPSTPSKADAPKSFQLQFGSISPGVVNGMQIPARTSSAPPNLDEQKRDQAQHDSFRAAPAIPAPSVSKQQPALKDSGSNKPSGSGELHAAPSHVKRDVHPQAPSAAGTTVTQKPVHPIPGISMPMPFQSQVPIPFGGPNSQLQSQGVPTTSLQMPMPLPVGSAPHVQQQVFVPGLQSHPIHPSGMMPQAQNLSFTTQIGHQMPPQMANMGIGIPPQYSQQPGKLVSHRKTVKITHPDTHEELMLDKRTDSYKDSGSSGVRSHPNVPPHTQPMPPFPPHQTVYYPPMQPGSYSHNMYFPTTQTAVPLTSAQMSAGPQGPRYTYPGGHVPTTISFKNPSSLNSLPAAKSLEHPHDSQFTTGSVSLPSVQVTVKPAVVSMGESVGTSSVTISSPAVNKVESPKLLRVPKEANTVLVQKDSNADSGNSKQSKSVNEPEAAPPLSANGKHSTTASAITSTQKLYTSTSSSIASPTEDPASVASNIEGKQKEAVRRTESFKDRQKKAGKKDARNTHLQNQEHALVQEDVSNHASTVKPASPRLSRDVVRGSDSMQSPHSDMVELTPPNLNSKDLTNISSFKSEKSVEGLSSVGGGSLVSSEEPLPDASVSVDSVYSRGGEISSTPIDKTDVQSGGIISDTVDGPQHNKRELVDTQHKQECVGKVEEKSVLPGGSNQGGKSSAMPMEPTHSVSSKVVEQTRNTTDAKESNITKESDLVGDQKDKTSVGSRSEVEKISDSLLSSATSIDSVDVETTSLTGTSDEKASIVVASTSSVDKASGPDVSVSSATAHQGSQPDLNADSDVLRREKSAEITGSVPSSKEKPTSETNRAKNMTAKGKKKRKDILKAADAAGSTSDLYMAYKGPEEKQENVVSAESLESSSSNDSKQATTVDAEKDIVTTKEDGQIKAEPDDWEDAAELSTPKLKTSGIGKQGRLGSAGNNEDGNISKKYSRDFLLTLSEQCTDLPTGFEIGSDIAESLMSVQVGLSHLVDREMYPNAGRNIDRTSGGPRSDRRGNDDDKWNKTPGSFVSVRDGGHGGPGAGFRPGPGGNHGVLRNPRGQPGGQYVGGILSGPAQNHGPQGGMQRSNSDADRWQRATGYHKGLIPSPQTPLQVMHKAEKKYEIRKVSDIEEAKQRQLKAILNKLTPQNFDKLFEQVKEVNIDNAVTLTGVISQIFDKALMEPTFCEMYANFCSHLAAELPDFSEDNEKITFKRLLLNKCQEEFERGEREQAEANRVEEEGEVKCSDEEREEKRIQARRRMLGNIRLIGELYKKKMLTERIMHECIKKLLGQSQNPDEEDIESLCKLMSTIGAMIDHPKAKEHMDAYFDIMTKFSNNMKLSSRVRFMLKDAIDLRKNKWQQRRKVEGPKKIEEVHRDAAQERQAQATRLARGPSMGSSTRRGMDFSPRGSSVLPSPNPQMGGLRGYPNQARGYGQDVRMEERHPYESRTLAVPLSQRPLDDNTITLGPQGGLGRGMSVRGHPLMSGVPLVDTPSGDPRRFTTGPNGYSSPSDWTQYPREEVPPRYSAERSAAMPAHDQSNIQERNAYHGNRDLRVSDRSMDRSMASSSAPVQAASVAHTHTAPEKTLSEERLRDMSISAIREFYSANDKEELALCIKELNAPNFYPSMISSWVTDSFDRKDLERDLLAGLLVDLTKPRDGLLSQIHLIKGFESVLAELEDAVPDAPKAVEYLGRILSKVILENVVPLKDVGHLIREGGEPPGRLLEIGLAAEVLGSILEIIRLEKGESVLNEIRKSSNLRLEDFRPPDPIKMKKLEAFF